MNVETAAKILAAMFCLGIAVTFTGILMPLHGRWLYLGGRLADAGMTLVAGSIALTAIGFLVALLGAL